ncbi:MAG: hypothetical protein HKN70_02260 [Gammaproteobacteria bacterium]|nr:hypothetical protein [Gammaproteobacteria bacterium]
MIISRWRGTNIVPGDNQLEVEVHDRSGAIAQRIVRNVHYSGGPVRARFNQNSSKLVADGRSRPLIVLDMFDREGYPARPAAVGVYHVAPPYRSQWEVDAARENQLISVGDRDPVYSLNEQGQAEIELEPTSRAGEVVLNLSFENNREQEVRVWLAPAARDWILVGLAEGTVGYRDIKDNLQNALDDDLDEDIYDDGRVAFFAKGRVKGEFLLTLAYDTRGDRDKDKNGLLGTVDPDSFYTLYGDATDQRFDAASQEKLYLKIERGTFYAMFGDHPTGMTVTELSSYNRTLNGFKSEFKGEHVSYNVFAAQTDQAFVKDELNGDGTSGLYRLSRRPLVINSEKVTIEVRDRFRTEEIIESRSLARHLDYNVDYLNGTLFFKKPVPSRDQFFNPVFIVVDYESRDQQDEELTAGGRAALRFGEGRAEIGVSGISEGMNGGDGELYGADLRYEFRPGTELRAEYATSESVQNGLASEGDAYVIEVRHQGEKLQGKVYAREQESGFGLGQQRGTESGTRKTGFDGRLRLSHKLSFDAQAYEQENLGSGSVRQVAQGEVRYQSGRGTFGVGLRNATDEDVNGSKQESRQTFVNASVQALDNRLTLRGSTEFSAGRNANTDFPRRTVLGMDYRLDENLTAFAEHEFADGDNVDTQTTRAGLRITPWERAAIDASVNQQSTEYGPRVFANVGLIQGWQVNERWTVDAGLDHGNTVRQPAAVEFDPDTPPTSGGIATDFTAVFLGALFRSEFWSASSRLEYRNSTLEERRALLLGLYREEQAGKGFTLNAQIFDSDTRDGTQIMAADVRLGWAFRPVNSQWVVFDRLDLVYADLETPNRAAQTWKLVNNLNANWMYSRDTQIAFQYGAKYVRSEIAANAYSGFSDLLGVAVRHDLSSRWDVAAHGDIRHSWRADVYDYSVGIEAGVTFAKNAWLSIGYNFIGFEDDEFSQAEYLAYGPYLKFRLKADQHTLDDLRRGMLFRREESALSSRRRVQPEEF